MKIGIICTIAHPVPPKVYGGVQAVNFMTAEMLTVRGHDVTLFGHRESRISGRVVAFDDGLGEQAEKRNARRLKEYLPRLDVLIDTTTYGFPGRLCKDIPYLFRLGGDIQKHYCGFIDRNVVFPSHDHLRFHSQGDCACSRKRPTGADVPVIPKPVSFWSYSRKVEDIPFSDGSRKGYFLWLGLIQEHKGAHLALEFAERAGVELTMVGPIGDQKYFDAAIRPRLGPKIKYFPAVGPEKWELYKNARGTVFTSDCHDADPNVPKESMLAGTPVLALDRGAVREIVADQKTGLLCADIAEMAARYRELDRMKPEDCRAQVLSRFSVDVYIDRWLELIRAVQAGKQWH